MPNTLANKSAAWSTLPDSLLFSIFQYLKPRSLLRASQASKQWYRVAIDEFLWKDLFISRFKISSIDLHMAPDAVSWLGEFKRLHYHTPLIETEVLREHKDQVLHVSFSHRGHYFATSSKDGFVKVWEMARTPYVKYYEDMNCYNWRYTQYTQFNESDTLLLVSGVHFGTQSTSGEIAIFNLENGFALQCTVRNKPYDIFGTWYNDQHLLSGNLHWLGNFSSCSVISLNKSSQDLENIYESVVMQLFKFHNVNASSIRTIMVTDVPNVEDFDNQAPFQIKHKHNSEEIDELCGDGDKRDDSLHTNEEVSCDKCFWRSWSEIDVRQCEHNNAATKHAASNTKTDKQETALRDPKWLDSNTFRAESDVKVGVIQSGSSHGQGQSGECHRVIGAKVDALTADSTKVEGACATRNRPAAASGSEGDGQVKVRVHPLPCRYGRGGECSNSMICPPVIKRTHVSAFMDSNSNESRGAPGAPGESGAPVLTPYTSSISNCVSEKQVAASPVKAEPNKYLIFTTGTQTFTPHQIGIKRISDKEALGKMSKQAEQRHRHEQRVKEALQQQLSRSPSADVIDHDDQQDNEEESDAGMNEVDFVIEMDGHIIGMCLSKDKRYLYVNTRAWPRNYVIRDPLEPPPIAQQIEIHVIDLCTMTDLGKMHRAHKAFTPNDECFFIFLDVSDHYVASGAEDKHGYLWDRHYGVLLNKFKHDDVVNSVAFHPQDSETLVSVSDDNSVKIWRSLNRCRELGIPTRKQVDNEPSVSSLPSPEELSELSMALIFEEFVRNLDAEESDSED